MDERSYKWFLQELCNSHSNLKILETGICRGAKVMYWFGNTKSEEIFCRNSKVVTKTKHLLNYFLNSRVPLLEEYAPEKIICFLYHKTGKRLVTAKESIELAENQLHGLQVTSIHMSVTSESKVYTVAASNIGGEFSTEIFESKFGKNNFRVLKDQMDIDKIVNFLIRINELLVKISNKEVDEVNMDLTKDQLGAFVLIRLNAIKLKLPPVQRIVKKSSIKIVAQDYSEEHSYDDDLPSIYRLSLGNYFPKDKVSLKVPMKKPPGINQDFLEMIGNTIEKSRKKSYDVQESNPELKNETQERGSKKSWDNLNELLFYLEQTRPKIWLKDSVETPSVKNYTKYSNSESRIGTAKQTPSNRTLKVSSLMTAKSSSRVLFRGDLKVKVDRRSV